MKTKLFMIFLAIGLNAEAKTNLAFLWDNTSTYSNGYILTESKPRMVFGLEARLLEGFSVEAAYSLTTSDEARGEINFYSNLNDDVKVINGINAATSKQVDGFQFGLKYKDTVIIEYMKNTTNYTTKDSVLIGLTVGF